MLVKLKLSISCFFFQKIYSLNINFIALDFRFGFSFQQQKDYHLLFFSSFLFYVSRVKCFCLL